MTDMTDVQRTEVRNTARTILDNPYDHTAAACELASFVLANVDAPNPRLMDRMLDWWTHHREDQVAFSTLVESVDQMEHDLAEARAEVERLTAERDRIANGRYITYAEVDGKAVQKGAESNAETPNPAYVKPGEAWVVECRGERRTAVKDMDDDVPWNTVAADGLFFSEENENVTLLHRLVPAPRIITNPDDLEQLRNRSMVLDGVGRVCTKNSLRLFTRSDRAWITAKQCLASGPATVLWEPGA